MTENKEIQILELLDINFSITITILLRNKVAKIEDFSIKMKTI